MNPIQKQLKEDMEQVVEDIVKSEGGFEIYRHVYLNHYKYKKVEIRKNLNQFTDTTTNLEPKYDSIRGLKEIRPHDGCVAFINKLYKWYAHYLWANMDRRNAKHLAIPPSISKYFNYSHDREDYEPWHDSCLEIFRFPKTEYPTYQDFVRFMEELWAYPANDIVEEDYKDYQYPDFQLIPLIPELDDREPEVILGVEDMYCPMRTKFEGFSNLFKSERQYDAFDFLPHRDGYRGQAEVRVRCILVDNNSNYDAIYETDNYFMYFSGSMG